jgi:hypothetical protein
MRAQPMLLRFFLLLPLHPHVVVWGMIIEKLNFAEEEPSNNKKGERFQKENSLICK